MILNINWEHLSSIATVFSGAATIVGIILGLIQLFQIKRTNYATGFMKACELLQTEEAREERGFVYASLQVKPFQDWSPFDKGQGERVCHKFDTVGAMQANGIITYEMVMHWKTTILRTWEILEPLVMERRVNSGKDLWDDYERIAQYAANQNNK